MRNMLALVGLALVVFVGVGVWQGWFKVAFDSDKKVSVDFDTKKASEDTKKGIEALKDKVDHLKKDSETTPTPASTAGPGGK